MLNKTSERDARRDANLVLRGFWRFWRNATSGYWLGTPRHSAFSAPVTTLPTSSKYCLPVPGISVAFLASPCLWRRLLWQGQRGLGNHTEMDCSAGFPHVSHASEPMKCRHEGMQAVAVSKLSDCSSVLTPWARQGLQTVATGFWASDGLVGKLTAEVAGAGLRRLAHRLPPFLCKAPAVKQCGFLFVE